MADAQVLEASGSGVTASTTTWVDVATIAAASFTAGATYLIVAFANLQCNNATNNLRARLVRGTTPTEFTDALDEEEVLAGTTEVLAGWMVKFTQPGTTELVKLQISNSSTSTTTALYGHILAIKLDDVGALSTDYFWAEVTADLTTTASYQDGASVTFSANGTDRYLYIGQLATTPGDVNAQLDAALNVDGTLVATCSEEGEELTNERRNRLLVWAATPSSGSHTVKIQAKHETTAGTVLSSRVFALNLSKFAQSAVANGAGPTALTAAATWVNLATASLTPAATGDFVIIGSVDYSVGAQATDTATRLQHSGSGSLASAPAYGDSAPANDSWDGTDERIVTLFDKVTMNSGASRTVNLDGNKITGATNPTANGRALAVFSVALAGGSALGRTAADSLGLADSPARAFAGARALAQGLGLADAASRVFVGARAAADGLTLGNVVAATRIYVRSAADALGLGNAVTRTAGLVRPAGDSIGLGDVVARALTITRTAADGLTAGHAVNRALTLVRTAGDALAAADAVVGLKVYLRSAADTLGLADAVAAVKTGVIARTAGDGLGLGDGVARIVSSSRSAADSLGLGDSVTRVLAAARAAAQGLSLADVVTGSRTFVRSAGDALSLGNAVTRVTGAARSASDALGLGNAVTRAVGATRSTSDALGLGNAVSRTLGLARSATQGLGLADAVSVARSYVRSATDALSLASVVDAIKVGGGMAVGGPPPVAWAARAIPAAIAAAIIPDRALAINVSPDGRALHPRPEGD